MVNKISAAYGAWRSSLVKLHGAFVVVFCLLVYIAAYEFVARDNIEESIKEHTGIKTVPAINKASMMDFSTSEKPVLLNKRVESPMGIGFFKPNYFEHQILYFYGGVNLEKELREHVPADSVVFAKDQYENTTTSYAPPWLYPEHLKLDYGIIIFKVLGEGRDFIKVEANRESGQITYLDKNAGTFTAWPEFLLSVHSVEFNEVSLKKVFVKPLDYAGEVNTTYDFMQPLLVEEDWMYVKLVDDGLHEQGRGWIRWKRNGVLLVSYSLLS